MGLVGARVRSPLVGIGSPRRRAPWPLVLVGTLVGLAGALPLAYLIVRALGVQGEVLPLVLRPRTLEVLAQTLALGLSVGVLTALIGVPLAWVTTRTDLPGRRWWSVLSVVPLAIPSYVTAFAFVAALGPQGALQDLLEPLGVRQLPSIYGFPGALLVLTLATYPYVVLSTRAALLRLDPDLESAARSLGDAPMVAFARVTLPVLAPAIAAGVLLAVLYALADFGAVAILRYESFAQQIHVQYRASFDRSLAAVLALMLVAVSLAVTWGEARLRRRARSGVSRPRRRTLPTIPLGRWRWPALGFCAGVMSLSLVLPAGTILYWLIRGAERDSFRWLGDVAVGTLAAGSAAAVVAAALALPVAALVVRWPGRVAAAVERATYVSYAVPGIVIALALVAFTANAVPILYQTPLLLVLAYAVRFLPQATGAVRVSLAQVGPRVEEAGRALGRSPMGVFRTITLPLMRPGIVAGAALVFLTTVKELPMTLLLGPIGFETLATSVWSAVTAGSFTRAAAPAAILMVLSAATVALLLRAEDPMRTRETV